jgi:integrase
VPDGRGLYLRVQPGGARSWLLRYQIAGKVHDLGLGSYPEIGLADARGRALAARRVKANGNDPLAMRRAEREAKRIEEARSITFRDCAERYIAAHEAGWRNAKHRAQWPSTLTAYVYPELGALPVAAIDTGLVVRVLEPIWRAKPETAVRVRGRIEARLRQGHRLSLRREPGGMERQPRPCAAGPPEGAQGRASREPALCRASRVHGRASGAAGPSRPLPRIRDFDCGALRRGDRRTVAGNRRGSPAVVHPRRAHGEKGGRDHKAPLAGAAMALLADLPREGTRIFGGSNMAMAMLLRRMGRGDLTVHGFRSTFATWCKDVGVAAELREMALAHAECDKVAAAYTSGAEVLDRRRELAERWARFCASERGQVVPLRRA